jgi:hypothetical protein
MTYVVNSSTSLTTHSSNGPHHQFQQTPWNYEYGEDRTSVTYPSTANETTFESTASQISRAYEVGLINNLQKYLELLNEPLQDLSAPTQSWHYLGRRLERLPGSIETFLGLIKILPEWRSENTTSASLLSESQIQQIERYYGFRDDTEVKHALREYPFLAQLLLDTHSKIAAHFPDSQTFLEVAIDYEASDQYPGMADNSKELVISISTSLPSQEAMKTLKEFYDSWWSKALKEAKGKISVGLEFQ